MLTEPKADGQLQLLGKCSVIAERLTRPVTVSGGSVSGNMPTKYNVSIRAQICPDKAKTRRKVPKTSPLALSLQ